MNLYKKIYEAINTGIQKALILDDCDDISINYRHKKINNNTNLMFYYVDELLNDTDIKYNYEQIIKYYKETEHKYKVNDFNELIKIFNKVKDIKNVSWEWIENIKDYISIVLDDDTEINFYEKTDKKSIFLKFANDDILDTENEILIYLSDNHKMTENAYKWQDKHIQIQNNEHLVNMQIYGDIQHTKKMAEKDYAGYENCLRIHNIVSNDPKKYGKIPAIARCLNLKINGYQGYLPSIGQLKIMSDNIDTINYILNYLNLVEIKLRSLWWSSTEYDNNYSWAMGVNDIYFQYGIKNTNVVRIFPLFLKL
ncbi:MAG: hypothetical protein [Wendovervirus sonii]|uniref:Uncharacterized protein n=1 Tax=phage Lak_Megaphage_Sonny TaxID=3109229 RepID=A0ABZ0Z6H0_9CAUD|nr:MAG: hypothetical protein [phage Lak_Megaphage_Sonny]